MTNGRENVCKCCAKWCPDPDELSFLRNEVERLKAALVEIKDGCERWHTNGYGSFCRNEYHEIVRKALSDTNGGGKV